jgi:hypothetical protein
MRNIFAKVANLSRNCNEQEELRMSSIGAIDGW